MADVELPEWLVRLRELEDRAMSLTRAGLIDWNPSHGHSKLFELMPYYGRGYDDLRRRCSIRKGADTHV